MKTLVLYKMNLVIKIVTLLPQSPPTDPRPSPSSESNSGRISVVFWSFSANCGQKRRERGSLLNVSGHVGEGVCGWKS